MVNRRIGGAGGGSDKAGGGLAAVVVVLVALGALGAGTTGVVGSGAGSSASVGVRKAESKNSAREGDSEAAWRRMGVRELKRVSKQEADCLSASHGQVQEFFLRTPCTSLDRLLLAVADGEGNSAVVSVAWVGFRKSGDVRAFKAVMDRQGSGDIRSLATPLLGLADIRFSGHNYGSETNGKGITIAEAEAATGAVAPDVLDALAEVAALLPRP
ncbi:hypothetical protein ACFFQW_22500 [Umezawaea endophytica]|uniref:Uncharacterized protein n=1 Tax=Umezawaea endophytica TaxID=1654476 RepID=A0A9X2VIT0_9PSEU|nr:hypothetical protein [Umezawaea endophytica]MCS7477326.1 hypothetical protein [Umezawaea endophytica]